MPAVFITGSGTNIGKTFVTAGLIGCFRARNKAVFALKPVVTGFDEASFRESDPAILLQVLGREVTLEAISEIAPWRFRAPLSPDMAADKEGRGLNFSGITGFCRTATAKSEGTLLIEGIGGLMVPLDESHMVLDLIVALGLPVVLVGGTYLGAISHLLCVQEVILNHGLDLRAIVLSETEASPVPQESTLATISNFARRPLFGLSWQNSAGQNQAIFEELADLISTVRPC